MSLFLRVGRLQDGLFEDNYLDMNTDGKSKILRRWLQFENENSDMQCWEVTRNIDKRSLRLIYENREVQINKHQYN